MQQAFFEKLRDSQTILLAGAGGGYDIFCGLPLYHGLRAAGKTVHLANLSFTDLSRCEGERPVDSLLRVDLRSAGPSYYFPELHLVAYLTQEYGDSCIYAILNDGAVGVQQAYRWMVQELKPDTLILVDGGTDMLMLGDEEGLGTPEEDISSLLAASEVEVAQKMLVCLGFGIDSFHGVCHAHFLENVSALIREGGFLGSWSLNRDTAEYDFFREACLYAFRVMPDRPSIVNGGIISAVEGEFGDVHSTLRTRGSELFINPLMTLYWAFELEKVAQQNLYLERIRTTRSRRQLSLAIETFHNQVVRQRKPRLIPH